MANRLANATSPYLLQHADNPVDWHPWGSEAFEEARRRDVPVFLSVGYSSCHWCHVMAHESFEDEAVARLLNERFVSIKVDREERPDVDAVYMQAVQAMTGRGGWPMSVFLTPDGSPYYAGTYWPREPRHGLPAFPQVAVATADAWRDRREEVVSSSASIAETLAAHRQAELAPAIEVSVADQAAAVVLERAWDRRLGGFGRAPKFPQAMTIEWLLQRHARTGDQAPLEAAVQALDAMARGGLHDQLAGGFARYATDAAWLVPHFEKMLYDNALLLPAYALAASLTDDRELARVTATTAAYLLDELQTDDGLFVSATDADSEGVEGRYFVWSFDELTDVLRGLDVDPDRWTSFLGATPGGNFEGANILHEPVPRAGFAAGQGMERAEFDREWEHVRTGLLAHRAHRVPPGVDDKVLTDWCALAVRGLVRAGLLLDRPDWVEAGERTARALHEIHVVDGRLQHTSKGHRPEEQAAGEPASDGRFSAASPGERRVSVPGFLDDHVLLALADLELFQATGEPTWFDRALDLAETAHARFHDDEGGGWFQTPHDGEPLYLRPKETWDNATPAGTSVMVEVCLVLSGLTGEHVWYERAEEGIRLLQEDARVMATGYGWLLRQLETLAAGPREVVIVGRPGPDRRALARIARSRPGPGTLVVVADPAHGDRVPLLWGRGEIDDRPAAYVCRNLVCDRPVTSADELLALLDGS